MKTNIYILALILIISPFCKSYGQCQNYHFKATSCTHEDFIPTTQPLNDGCEHWPAPLYNEDPHIAKYQNKLTINAPEGPDRTILFDVNALEPLMNWARAHWSAQCVTRRYLVWETTTNGGLFWWSINPTDWRYPRITNGDGYSALDPNNLTIIVDSSGCSPTSPRGRSEVIFNNCDEFYINHPEHKWTTTPNACEGMDCLDFQTIALHELGHYVGLAHDGSPDAVMFPYYSGRKVDFEPCDVDRFRRLYCLGSVGEPPVSVKEQMNPEDINLEIYPNPYKEYITLRFNLRTQEYIVIYITDANGKQVSLLADEIFDSGRHEMSYSVFNISSGYYFINLEFKDKILSKKLISIK